MIGYFKIKGEDTSRHFAVYLFIAKHKKKDEFKFYVGKTGDNNIGCNPVISRIGNHFSYSGTHTQMRDKIGGDNPKITEEFDYEYFYLKLDEYLEDKGISEDLKNKINEMERMLNNICQKIFETDLMNPLGKYAKRNMNYHKEGYLKLLKELFNEVYIESSLINNTHKSKLQKALDTEGWFSKNIA